MLSSFRSGLSDDTLAVRTKILEAIFRCQIHHLPNSTIHDAVIGETKRMPKIKPLYDCLMKANTSQDHDQCVSSLTKICNKDKITVVKTIRYPMYALGDLLRRLPDVAVVYYVRDPRGIMTSRRDLHHFRTIHMSMFTKNLCDAMLKNHEHFVELEKQFPDQVMLLRYEDLAFAPLEVASTIYEFIGGTLPEDVRKWIKQNTQNEDTNVVPGQWEHARLFETRRNSALAAVAWKSKLSNKAKSMIFEKCETVLKLYGYHKGK